MYINLGEVSEDVLRDGRKFYESGMPVDGSESYTTTQWGKIPTQATVTYAFATTDGSRELQDVGYNGLTDEEERETTIIISVVLISTVLRLRSCGAINESTIRRATRPTAIAVPKATIRHIKLRPTSRTSTRITP